MVDNTEKHTEKNEKHYHENVHGPWHDKWGVWYSEPELRTGGTMQRHVVAQPNFTFHAAAR